MRTGHAIVRCLGGVIVAAAAAAANCQLAVLLLVLLVLLVLLLLMLPAAHRQRSLSLLGAADEVAVFLHLRME